MNASALVITFTVTIATTFATAAAATTGAAIATAVAFLTPPYPPFRVVRVFRG